jgi:hypothetical protein
MEGILALFRFGDQDIDALDRLEVGNLPSEV